MTENAFLCGVGEDLVDCKKVVRTNVLKSHRLKIIFSRKFTLGDSIILYITQLPESTLKGQYHKIFLVLVFFHKSVTPQPQSIPLGQ
jgi:hypothetical protein